MNNLLLLNVSVHSNILACGIPCLFAGGICWQTTCYTTPQYLFSPVWPSGKENSGNLMFFLILVLTWSLELLAFVLTRLHWVFRDVDKSFGSLG